MTEDTPTEARPLESTDRWTLAKDVGLLQVKLIVDGFRDLLLVPISLVAGLISVFGGSDEDRSTFYRVVCIGKQSEKWINLFGAYDNAPQALKDEYDFGDRSIDDIVNHVENFVVDEYKTGGVTAQAKQQLDKALEEIRRNVKRSETDTW